MTAEMVRLFLSLGAAAVAAVVIALALTLVDLYLTGHGYASINREVISMPSAGIHLSPSDVGLLVGAIVAGVVAWFRLRRAR